MLGVLQMLYFVDTFPNTAIAICKRSQEKGCDFPLAIKMFEFSQFILVLMRTCKLYTWVN